MEADVLASIGTGSDVANVSAVKISPSSIIQSRKLIDFSVFWYQPPPASKRPLNTWDWRLGGG